MSEYQDYSLRSRVFQTLQQGILQGKYEEGDELREITIGKELGVSRTPVREALRQLELEGLVKIVPNRGAFVTGIRKSDVKDIYVIRSLLEGQCAAWATEHITEQQIEELEEIILLSEYHVKKMKEENAKQIVALDGKFHEVLYEASNSRIMKHVLSDFHKYVQLARKTSVVREDRAEKSIEEHKGILDAIRRRDRESAKRLANEHIINVMKNLNMEDETEHG